MSRNAHDFSRPRTPATVTSASDPIRVDWIPTCHVKAWSGRLGMTFCPGKQADGLRLNVTYARDLTADLSRIRIEERCDLLVTLLEPHEFKLLGVPNLQQTAESLGMKSVVVPWKDATIPSADRSAPGFAAALESALLTLRTGGNVVVHCRGGLGRTGTLVACLLIASGLSGQAATEVTRRARFGTIQTMDQELFVRAFAERFRPPASTVRRRPAAR